MTPQEQQEQRAAFEQHWHNTRGNKKASYELQRHPLQPQCYRVDSPNRHWVTWQAAQAQQAERLRVAESRLAYIESCSRVLSPKIDGMHSWATQYRNDCKGASLLDAIDAAIAKEQSK